MFVKLEFVVELGILRVSMNRIGKFNVVKGVYFYYNEYKDFYSREIKVYIFVLFMEMCGMFRFDGIYYSSDILL